jgi:subtilisin family serine protease
MKSYIIPLPKPPRIIPASFVTTFDLEVDSLLGVPKARNNFQVDGAGLAAAILDTGLRVTHECFHGRVAAMHNFTAEGTGPEDVTDTNGHGTNVAGIVAAGTLDERRGIAPGARLVPLKVLPAGLDVIAAALRWVGEHAEQHGITVANLSLGVPGVNMQNDATARTEQGALHQEIVRLTGRGIAVVVAAGNDYKEFEKEGMSLPAIFRECISVGAVYDASVGSRQYASGATAFSTHADMITPFSQRLAKDSSPDCFMDVLSAGGSATSAGAASDTATSTQDGTSQAAPTIAGIILLMQQFHLRKTGRLPPVELLQEVLRSTSTWIIDGDDEDDNVQNTGKKFPRVNAFESLVALDKAIKLA